MPGLYNIALRSASSSSSNSTTGANAHNMMIPSHRRHSMTTIPAAPSACVPGAPGPVNANSRALPAIQAAATTSSSTNNPPVGAAPYSNHVRLAQPIQARHIEIADPLTEHIGRARLHDSTTLNHYSSSGSPHIGDDPSTVCLAAMVHEFLEEEALISRMGNCGRVRCNCADGASCGAAFDDDDDGEAYTSKNVADEAGRESQLQDEHLCEILEGITSNCTSQPELLLLVDVARAVEAESEELAASYSSSMDHENCGAYVADRLRRPVMKRLREEGFNAAICKSHWKHADGLPAGDYEYIDIVVDAGIKARVSKKQSDRFIVDIDFKAQFEIARASKQYEQLLGVLPRLFVGKAERLKQILKIMSNAAKCSLKQQGLLLPPWRKHKYVQAKWFSPYRRTTNTEPLSPPLHISSQRAVLAGLGLRAPNILSLDFTKEMDLLFYKAQVRPVLRNSSNRNHEHTKNDLLHGGPKKDAPANAAVNGVDGNGGAIVRTGFLNSSVESLSLGCDASITAMCTDWQLPAVDDKCSKGISSGDYKVSGISTALRQAASLHNLPNQPSSRLAMVS